MIHTYWKRAISGMFAAGLLVPLVSVLPARAGEICKVLYTRMDSPSRHAYKCEPTKDPWGDPEGPQTIMACKDLTEKYEKAYLQCTNPQFSAGQGGAGLGESGSGGRIHYSSQKWVQAIGASGSAWWKKTAMANCESARAEYNDFVKNAGNKTLVFLECPNPSILSSQLMLYYRLVYDGTCEQYRRELKDKDVCSDGEPTIRGKAFNAEDYKK